MDCDCSPKVLIDWSTIVRQREDTLRSRISRCKNFVDGSLTNYVSRNDISLDKNI